VVRIPSTARAAIASVSDAVLFRFIVVELMFDSGFNLGALGYETAAVLSQLCDE
jgi:hypothetical protein